MPLKHKSPTSKNETIDLASSSDESEPDARRPPRKRETISLGSSSDEEQEAEEEAEAGLPTPALSDVMDVDETEAVGKGREGMSPGKMLRMDLEEVVRASKTLPRGEGIVRRVRKGDAEESVEFVVPVPQPGSKADKLVEVVLMITDAERYPSAYPIMIYATDDVPPALSASLESLSSSTHTLPLPALLESIAHVLHGTRTAASVGRKKSSAVLHKRAQQQQQETNEEDGSEDSFDAFAGEEEEEEMLFGGPARGMGGKEADMRGLGREGKDRVDLGKLRIAFEQLQSYGFKPGIAHLTDVDLVLSISLPLSALHHPPSVLAAWDARLGAALTKGKNLVLLLSLGGRAYPPPYVPMSAGARPGAGKGRDGKGREGKGKGKEEMEEVREWAKLGGGWKCAVGLCGRYKPRWEEVLKAMRTVYLKPGADKHGGGEHEASFSNGGGGAGDEIKEDDLEPFLLSGPLAQLLNESLWAVANFRRKHSAYGWPAAEALLHDPEYLARVQEGAVPQEEMEARLLREDAREKREREGAELPKDPLQDPATRDNLPLIAMSYLVRRLKLATRFCIVCHGRQPSSFEALRPFVCSKEICGYAFQALGVGPPLEYELRSNASAVDLLLSVTYAAAAVGALPPEHQPLRLGIEVPESYYLALRPPHSDAAPSNPLEDPNLPADRDAGADADPLRRFDDDKLTQPQRNFAIANLIASLPRVSEMREFLMSGQKLVKLRSGVEWKAALVVLRWVVSSNLSYIKEADENEMIRGAGLTAPASGAAAPYGSVSVEFKQFKFICGSPEKEHLFRQAVEKAKTRYPQNNKKFPTLFAFHGSGAKNWHSILREGLHFKTVTNGRAYGNGCYFARQGEVSLNTYSAGHHIRGNTCPRPNADFKVFSITAVVELVNAPKEFISNNPYLVVDMLDWISPRFLLIRGEGVPRSGEVEVVNSNPAPRTLPSVKIIEQDATYFSTLSGAIIQVPANMYDSLEVDHEAAGADNDYAPEDRDVLEYVYQASKEKTVFVPADEERMNRMQMLPAPMHSSSVANITLAREFRNMIKLQNKLDPVELGYYLNPDQDSLYQWIIELHSFPEDSALHADLKSRGIKSVLVELRFGPEFPQTPPFMRILHPRFLNFLAGGGGHITAGGSICHSLLTADSWLPSYSIESLLQDVKMNMVLDDPRPARIDTHRWDRPYSTAEARDAFIRVANQHGWKIPPDFDSVSR